VEKTIHLPATPLPAGQLPALLAGFGAAPPLITDIGLSLDDRFLYVSCWGTGEVLQYDVTDPHHPRSTGAIEIGGLVRHTSHPSGAEWAGGPQMIEISRDGRRLYATNSLYRAWDEQFYPGGVPGAMLKADCDVDGGIRIDPDFLVEFGGYRAHQDRLQGGDCSTDSYCFV
jgi:selenium-binding protein 1